MNLSAGFVIAESFRTYFKHFVGVIRYPLIMALLWGMFGIASIAFLGTEFLSAGEDLPDPSWGAIATVVMMLVIVAIASIPLTLAMTRTLYRLYMGQPADTISNEVHAVKHLIWPSIYTSLLAGIIILGGFILLIIPGIWLGLRYSLVHTALAIDGKTGPAALKVSSDLIRGRWWRVFWWSLAAGVVIWIVSTVLQFVVLTPVGFLASMSWEGGWVLSNLLGPVVSLLVFPLGALPAIIIYAELKKIGPATEAVTPNPVQ